MNKEKQKYYIIHYLLLMVLTYIIINTVGTSKQFLIIMEFFYYLFMFLLSREIVYKIGIVPRKGEHDEVIELSTQEANMINFKNRGLRDPLHSERLDNASGTDYKAKIIKKEDGREILVETERYGGMYYFGSLISVIILVGLISAMIYSAHKSLLEHKAIDLIISFFLIPFMSALFVIYNKLIEDIKEKQKVKQEIREGIREKEKLSIPNICYRIMTFSFLGAMFVGFIAVFVNNIPESINQLFGFIGLIGIIGFIVGFFSYIISSIIAYFISLKKH